MLTFASIQASSLCVNIFENPHILTFDYLGTKLFKYICHIHATMKGNHPDLPSHFYVCPNMRSFLLPWPSQGCTSLRINSLPFYHLHFENSITIYLNRVYVNQLVISRKIKINCLTCYPVNDNLSHTKQINHTGVIKHDHRGRKHTVQGSHRSAQAAWMVGSSDD